MPIYNLDRDDYLVPEMRLRRPCGNDRTGQELVAGMRLCAIHAGKLRLYEDARGEMLAQWRADKRLWDDAWKNPRRCLDRLVRPDGLRLTAPT